MARRQLCLVFVDEVKQFVRFKASFECREGRCVCDCVLEVIPMPAVL